MVSNYFSFKVFFGNSRFVDWKTMLVQHEVFFFAWSDYIQSPCKVYLGDFKIFNLSLKVACVAGFCRVLCGED